MAGGMEAEDYLGARGPFDAQALGADRHAAVGADLECRADTPNIRPRGRRGRARDEHCTCWRGALPPGWCGLAMGLVTVQ